jgi:hypothetical protein
MTISLESLREIREAVECSEEPLTMFGTRDRIVTLTPKQLRDLKSILRNLIGRHSPKKRRQDSQTRAPKKVSRALEADSGENRQVES